MRVLFLATRDWQNPAAGGGDIQMWEYARYLASRGHAVTFAASSYAGAPRTEMIEGITVVRLGAVLTLWLQTFLYYMRRGRAKFDIVVAEGFGGARIPRLAPLYVREPVVTEWHQVHRDLFASQYPKVLLPALNLLERITAYVHRNTLVRAGTREWQEAFAALGFERGKIFVVPVSIREEWLNGAQPTKVPEPRIVWIGKFRRYKCPHHVIEALRTVVDEGIPATLILAGRHDDRKYESRLQRLVRDLRLEQRVEFRFDITEEEKARILKHARVFVLPSSVEGFGIVVLEANACGVPVVASSGVPEGAVQHLNNGLRYPFSDTRSLSQQMVRLLTDDELYVRLSGSSLAFARQFAWSRVGAQFEDILKSASQRGTTQGHEVVQDQSNGMAL